MDKEKFYLKIVLSHHMNSRERVLTALEHREPDRVPIDLSSCKASGISAIAYNKLKSYWGISTPTLIWDELQQLALPDRKVLERIGADILPIWVEPSGWRKWELLDGSLAEISTEFNPELLPDESRVLKDANGNLLAKMPKHSYYFDTVYHPLNKAKSAQEIERGMKKFETQYILSEKLLRKIRNKAKYLYEQTNYALMAPDAGSIYEQAQNLRGWGQFMIDLVANPELATRLLDLLVEVNIKRVEPYLASVGEYAQVIQVGDDLGMQNGLQLSPSLYKKMIKPRQKEFYKFIKQNSGAYLFLHSCGSIYRVIPDLIEIGVDILHPVQVSAKNMDSNRLKKEFGNSITFWGGGCDTQRILPFGTPQEVEAEVKRRIEDFAPGGGFVFTQVHNIQADVPPQNIDAMYQAVNEYGSYQ
jgi:uroporphyrinogen decarboxylase